jgi:glycosyltransferase involved in cell wall biosynthesis
MLRELSEEYEVIALSSKEDLLTTVGQREGVRTIGVNMARRFAPLKDIVSLFRLIRVFRREKPDIVHSMTPKAGLLCMMAAWFTRVPTRIHTFTGLVFPTATGIARYILMLTDRITCGCATHIIPEGNGVKNDLIRYKITRKPMHVLGYGNVRGVDLKYFKPEQEKHDDFRFLYIGRIAGEKCVNEMVEAFVQMPGDAQLWMVGSMEQVDPIHPNTRHLIETHPRIKWFGPADDVRPYFNQTDCLVLASYREGFPNVVIESGAMERPAIVTDINGSREIIQNHKNGVIVPVKDTERLKEAMIYMKDHPLQAHQMGQAARPLVEQKFEQSFVRKCLYNYYKEITNAL